MTGSLDGAIPDGPADAGAGPAEPASSDHPEFEGEWWNGTTLDGSQTIREWLAADPSLKLRTAARYEVFVITSNARVRAVIQSGELRPWSENVLACMDQMIGFGLETRQKNPDDPINALGIVCALMLQQS